MNTLSEEQRQRLQEAKKGGEIGFFSYPKQEQNLESFLADELARERIEATKVERKRIAEVIMARIKSNRELCRSEEDHPYEGNSCPRVYSNEDLEDILFLISKAAEKNQEE